MSLFLVSITTIYFSYHLLISQYILFHSLTLLSSMTTTFTIYLVLGVFGRESMIRLSFALVVVEIQLTYNVSVYIIKFNNNDICSKTFFSSFFLHCLVCHTNLSLNCTSPEEAISETCWASVQYSFILA